MIALVAGTNCHTRQMGHSRQADKAGRPGQ
jgi:hypothetical protein